jgi:hypothetical protein
MQGWCDEFAASRRRQPRLWLDKVCIDQTDLKRDLQCLPIFLAGCDRLVITCGPTYPTRLWCCVELFVYTHMMSESHQERRDPIVLSLFESESQSLFAWRHFDAAGCECFDTNDKIRMLEHIGRHPGGVCGFNETIRRLLGAMQSVLLTPGCTPVSTPRSASPSRQSERATLKWYWLVPAARADPILTFVSI